RILQSIPEAVGADRPAGGGSDLEAGFAAAQGLRSQGVVGRGEDRADLERAVELIERGRPERAVEGPPEGQPIERAIPRAELGRKLLVAAVLKGRHHRLAQSGGGLAG